MWHIIVLQYASSKKVRKKVYKKIVFKTLKENKVVKMSVKNLKLECKHFLSKIKIELLNVISLKLVF